MAAGDSNIKRINDPQQLKQIIEKLFCRLPLHLKEREGEYPVRIASWQEGFLTIEHNQGESASRLLSLSHGENRMFLECAVKERFSEKAQEVVKPIRLHLQRQIRREKRVEVAAPQSHVPMVTNLVPLKSIPERLSSVNENRDKIIKHYSVELSKAFEISKLQFRLTFRMDMRMRAMSNNRKAIFVPDKQNPRSVPLGDFVLFDEYKKVVQYEKIPDQVVAEICEPLFYRRLYLFGYLLAFSTEPLEMEHYEKIAELARRLEGDFEKVGGLPTNPERCIVADITATGMGLMHPHNPSILKDFMPGENVIFDLKLPEKERISMAGIIRNVKAGDRAHRIGLELDHPQADHASMIRDYIAGITSAQSS